MAFADGMSPIDNNSEYIDSREVIARIDYLRGLQEDQWNDPAGDYFTDEERAELAALEELASQCEDYAADWTYGETLIRYSYFEEYARELADDIGAVNGDEHWPATCIDWERAADELRTDYTEVEFDGVTYWIR